MLSDLGMERGRNTEAEWYIKKGGRKTTEMLNDSKILKKSARYDREKAKFLVDRQYGAVQRTKLKLLIEYLVFAWRIKYPQYEI